MKIPMLRVSWIICALTVLTFGSHACSNPPERPGAANAGAGRESASRRPQDNSAKRDNAYDQAPPEVLLKAAAAAYRNAETYWISIAKTSVTGDSVYKMRLVMASDLKDRCRLEAGEISFVLNGPDLWQRHGAEYVHTLTRYEGDPSSHPELEAAMSRARMVMRAMLDSLGRIDEGVKHLKWLGDEAILRNERRLRCARIDVEYDKGHPGFFSGRRIEYWIHRANPRILREEEDGIGEIHGRAQHVRETREFLVMRLDEPLPDSLFEFKPPPGVKEVSDFPVPRVDLAEVRGKDVEDFALGDLDGRQHRLGDLRGKVVVLVFWIVSSSESRRNLEDLGQLYPDLRRRGIEVLTVSAVSSRDLVRDFVNGSGYRFPVLLDSEHAVQPRFTTVIPTTVIVTRDGKVGRYLTGRVTLPELRTAVDAVAEE